MRKLRSLFWLFIKTTIGNVLNMQGSKWVGPVIVVSLVIAFAAMMFVVYNIFGGMFEFFAAYGHLEVAVGLGLNMGALIIFVFSMMAAPAIFYFAKDVEYLLPLPIKPEVIIGAKFAMALLFEYIISLIIMVPVFLSLLPHVSAGGLVVNTIITFLTLPILPLVYSTVLCMVLVAFFRIFRNPDKYSLFIGVLAMVLGVGFSMVYSQVFMVDMEALYDMLMGAPVVFAMNVVFISNSAAARALTENGIVLNQIINVGVTALALIIFFALARVLYFRGVVGLSESGAPAKKMTRDDIKRQSQGRGAFRSYLSKELKLLFRSPTAFLNCVLSAIIVPVVIAGSAIFSAISAGGDADMIGELLALVDFNNPRIAAVALASMCAIGVLVAGMTTVTATSISREGRNFFIMKYLPISYRDQINAKAASGFTIIIPAILLILIPLQIFMGAPLLIFIGGTILAFSGAVFLNYLGLLIDLAKPKLDWDNEQAAVKNSVNVLIMTLGGMALTAGIVVGGFFLLHTPILAFIVLFIITVSLAITMYYLAMTRGVKLLKELY